MQSKKRIGRNLSPIDIIERVECETVHRPVVRRCPTSKSVRKNAEQSKLKRTPAQFFVEHEVVERFFVHCKKIEDDYQIWILKVVVSRNRRFSGFCAFRTRYQSC